MLCTLKLFTPHTDMVDLDFIQREHGDFTVLSVDDKYRSCKINIRNFQFTCDSYGLHLEGSAPRFMNGNNITTLKYHQIQPFIYQLSQAVGFDVSPMKITRIDITDNMHMEKPPKAYKRYMGKCRYFLRTDYSNNGLNYVNNTRNLLFYDKLLEVQNKVGFAPAEHRGKNLLRYEYSIRKRRKDHLGSHIKTLGDLRHPHNYLTLIDRWEMMFHQIEKISYQSSVEMPYKPGMKVKDWLSLKGAQLNGGMVNTLHDVDEMEASGHITERQRDYAKKSLLKSQNRYNSLQNASGDLKEELGQKLRRLAEENRRMI